jgi:hypothetical protein
MIENCVGVAHGWTIPDHNAFDEDGSERHYRRLLTLLSEALYRAEIEWQMQSLISQQTWPHLRLSPDLEEVAVIG